MRKIIIDLLMKLGSSAWSDLAVFETLFVSQIVSAAQQKGDPDSFVRSMLLKYSISELPFSLDDDGVKNILLRIASYAEKMPPADLYRVICPFAVVNEEIDTVHARKSSFYYAVCQAIRFLNNGEPSGLAVMVRDAVNSLPFPGSDESTDIIVGAIESIENIAITQSIPTGRNIYEDEFYKAASKMGLSPYQAMELYGIFLSDKDEYISTPTPWKEACRRHHYLSQKYSDLDMDDLFDHIVFTAKSDPLEMVRSFLYSPEKDETGFHTTYMTALVCSVIKPEYNLLLIDPSPEVLHIYNSINVHCDCVVLHAELLQVYRQIFPNIGLFQKDDIPFMNGRYDIIVDASGWLKKGVNVDEVFSFRMLCGESCLIISEIRNDVFEKNKEELLRLLYSDNQMLLSYILRLPDLFPERTERKKGTSLFVFNTSTISQEFHNVEIYTMKCHSATTARILHEHPYVKYSEFLNSKKTIKQITDSALTTLRGKEKGGKRSLPKNFFITPDVAVQIGIYNPKNGKYTYIPGSLNYRKADGTNLLSNSKRLTGKDLPTLLKNMEDLAYKDLYSDISDDVHCRIRKRIIKNPSLKTIWYILRNTLKEKKSKYNEELCRDIFSDNHPCVSGILVFSAKESDYSFAFADDYRVDGIYQIPLKTLRQIDIILSVAEKKQLPVQRKSIQELIKKVSNAMTDGQMEVRNALTKRAYDDDEEERLIRYIFEHADDESDTVFVLYMILRLYLPATINEIRALKLRDYIRARKADDLHVISISKYKNGDDATVLYMYAPKDRDLPIPICFTDVFMACVQRLHGEDDADIPLIPSPEDMGCFLAYAEAQGFDKRIDSIARVDEKHFSILLPDRGKERMTDLYDFFGDIHYTHWKYIAKEAGLEENEITYILGLKPTNTFAAHYADYGCPLSLKKIARKINRWITGFLSCDMTVRKETGTIPLKTMIGLSQRKTRLYGEIKEAEESIIVQTDNRFGRKVTITVC